MTTVGFIGSGKIGSTVARLAVAAGYRVVLSNSRGPQTLAELAAARRDGQIAVLDNGLTSSELLQRLLPGSVVVKVFNNIYSKHLEHLSRPSGVAPTRTPGGLSASGGAVR